MNARVVKERVAGPRQGLIERMLLTREPLESREPLLRIRGQTLDELAQFA